MDPKLPNKLTMLRMFLVPIILLLMVELPWQFALGFNRFNQSMPGRILVLSLFCFASLTDFFDGMLARKYNLVSNFGKFMDPLADKLLILGVFLAYVASGRLHALLYFLILGRELVITGLRQVALEQGVVISASWWGKWKTTFQMFAIISLMIEGIMQSYYAPIEGLGANSAPKHVLFVVLSDILLTVAIILTVVSAIDYLYKNRRLFFERSHKA